MGQSSEAQLYLGNLRMPTFQSSVGSRGVAAGGSLASQNSLQQSFDPSSLPRNSVGVLSGG